MSDRAVQKGATWQRLFAFLLVVAITLLILLFRHRLADYERYGYLGIFLVNLMGSGTVILPVPALLVVYLGGSIWNPLLVGLVAGLASALGEITGYLLGYSGQGLVQDQALYARMEGWMKRNGFLTILILAIIPNPVFDVAGMAAGALRFPLRWFLLSALIGKSIKMIAVAYAGAYSLIFVRELIQRM